MLKRIRKMSKQKASGKEQEELAKTTDKPENQVKDKTEIIALINERDTLREEVKSLKQQLENENVRYTELKALKSQQVCALTFKLAKAVRDKETAVEECENIKQELLKKLRQKENEESVPLDMIDNGNNDKETAVEECENIKQELLKKLRQKENEESVPLDMIDNGNNSTPLEESCRGLSGAEEGKECKTLEDDEGKETSCKTMSCFVVIGQPIDGSKINGDEIIQEEVQVLVENPCGGGEEVRKAGKMEEAMDVEESSDCSSDTHPLSQSSIKSDDQKRKVIAEFRRIQQELFDVKKNMSMVQALNERLSRDLQSLVDKKNSHPLVKSESLRKRKTKDFVDGKKEQVFVFPTNETIKNKDHRKASTMQDVSTETEICDLEQSEGLEKKAEQSRNEVIESSNQESLEENPDQLEFEAAERINDDVAKERQDNVMEVRKQLEKAMKELEELRTDNREMKNKINKIASFSTDHDDFLSRTTKFTGLLLNEMRERDQKMDRKMSKRMPNVEQPPLNILGTRLNEITKTVDDMTKPVPIPQPLEAEITKDPNPPPVKAVLIPNRITRPQSAGLSTMPTPFTSVFAKHDTIKAKPVTEEKKRRFTTGKLGKSSLSYRHAGLLDNEVGLKRSLEPLAKEWRSTDTLSPRSSFTGSLGYKDYIQRHIVMSSNAIAKIRDLKPEELDGRIFY